MGINPNHPRGGEAVRTLEEIKRADYLEKQNQANNKRNALEKKGYRWISNADGKTVYHKGYYQALHRCIGHPNNSMRKREAKA